MAALSRVGEIVRRHDPDRFFTALFAPAAKREALFTLYAFNHELARAREVAREPMMALIRLQWWREVAEGARRRHEVAEPLGALLDQGVLHPPDLLTMIEGREAEAEGGLDGPALCAAVMGSAGGLGMAAGRSLGEAGVPLTAIQDLAAAYGAAGVLRVAGSHPVSYTPDMLAALAAQGRQWLDRGRAVRLPRTTLAAALPGVFARRDLRRAAPVRQRPFSDRLAVLWAMARGAV